MRSSIIAIAAALVLGACSPLTSDHPLFSHADETGPLPLTEGVWVPLESDCTREMATATPIADACDQLTLRHTADGWSISGKDKDEHGAARTIDIPLVIVPAVRTANADAYAPLYIAQMSTRDTSTHSDAPPDQRIYGVVAPIGTLPATELFFTDIECDAAVREGPIAGVAETHGTDGSVTACVASNQNAVREAARRVLIEDVGDIDHERMIFVHP